MDLSIIIPVYNEEENLPLVFDAIHASMAGYGKKLKWEMIYVDDGSQDSSLAELMKLFEKDPKHMRIVQLRRNFGQTAAIAAGIDHAVGDIVVMLDADMQNDPADIPMMLDKLNEGYDVVSGWRKDRQDTYISRTLPSHLANSLISKVTGLKLHDYGCTLKAYRREVITGFHLYGEMHRFIPVYANSFGAKIIEVPVQHHPRKFGKAKYGLERTFKVILDLFTVKFLISYANKPIYLFGGFGVVLMALSALFLLYLFIRRTFFMIGVTQSPLFLISTVMGLMGFQSILLGLISELLVRTYHESQGKPIYNVKKYFTPDK
jgi:glycosyltransferase involved in cell wall biosynthesis